MFNAATVTNAFLIKRNVSILELVNVFFCFFFYILMIFSFFRLSENVLMKTYSLCSRRGDKKAFKEKKICGVIASK